SNFGSTQGDGKVWLGTAYGIVVGWSNTQIVAQIAPGARSGKVQVLQGGVWSNAVNLAINVPSLEQINPTSGIPGTHVTFSGTGFGSSRGSGVVQLGSTLGDVLSWSDTQIVAAVASSAVTGIARVQQNGQWSNSFPFTVPGSSIGGVTTLSPNLLNMIVGETRTVQALDAASHPVTGLSWTSSDPTVVSLSTDDPP